MSCVNYNAWVMLLQTDITVFSEKCKQTKSWWSLSRVDETRLWARQKTNDSNSDSSNITFIIYNSTTSSHHIKLAMITFKCLHGLAPASQPTWLTCASPFRRSLAGGSCNRLISGTLVVPRTYQDYISVSLQSLHF